jgi:hypothetical protein
MQAQSGRKGSRGHSSGRHAAPAGSGTSCQHVPCSSHTAMSRGGGTATFLRDRCDHEHGAKGVVSTVQTQRRTSGGHSKAAGGASLKSPPIDRHPPRCHRPLHPSSPSPFFQAEVARARASESPKHDRCEILPWASNSAAQASGDENDLPVFFATPVHSTNMRILLGPHCQTCKRGISGQGMS